MSEVCEARAHSPRWTLLATTQWYTQWQWQLAIILFTCFRLPSAHLADSTTVYLYTISVHPATSTTVYLLYSTSVHPAPQPLFTSSTQHQYTQPPQPQFSSLVLVLNHTAPPLYYTSPLPSLSLSSLPTSQAAVSMDQIHRKAVQVACQKCSLLVWNPIWLPCSLVNSTEKN